MDLRTALDRGELRVLYMPVVDLHTRKIKGFEAHVRWQHAERGLLSPSDFRGRAEETGLITAIDRWVLTETARQLAAWLREFEGVGRLTISMNFSLLEFERRRPAEELREILVRTALPPSSIALEITESLPAGNSESLLRLLNEISAGFNVHLGDFGTGRWSVVYLRRLPITALKIDPSFISGLGENGRDAAVVSAMIALARSLGLKCIAKNVKTEDQLASLRELGCDEAQGPVFSEPVTADRAHELLARSWR